MPLRPFFQYFGSKRTLAKHYPRPQFNQIIEPFAGSAGYSLHWHRHEITLLERDPRIAKLWQWLIRVSEDEFMAIPSDVTDTRTMRTSAEAKAIVGFWFQWGGRTPLYKPPPMQKLYPQRFWNEEIRDTLARQLRYIRHWRCLWADYTDANRMGPATWFIDPPYQTTPAQYRHNADRINFEWLGKWCRSRPGQVIVCEANEADWLPFRPFRTVINTHSTKQKALHTPELIWTRNTEAASTEAGSKNELPLQASAPGHKR